MPSLWPESEKLNFFWDSRIDLRNSARGNQICRIQYYKNLEKSPSPVSAQTIRESRRPIDFLGLPCEYSVDYPGGSTCLEGVELEQGGKVRNDGSSPDDFDDELYQKADSEWDSQTQVKTHQIFTSRPNLAWFRFGSVVPAYTVGLCMYIPRQADITAISDIRLMSCVLIEKCLDDLTFKGWVLPRP